MKDADCTKHEYHHATLKKQRYDRYYDGSSYRTITLEDEHLQLYCINCGEVKNVETPRKDRLKDE